MMDELLIIRVDFETYYYFNYHFLPFRTVFLLSYENIIWTFALARKNEWHKTQEMRYSFSAKWWNDFFLTATRIRKTADNVVSNYSHALKFAPNFWKTQKVCNKVADTYPSGIHFVSEYYKIQKMCFRLSILVFL